MYTAYYGSLLLNDPSSDDARIHGGTISGDQNDVMSFTFTLPTTHPLVGQIAECDFANPVTAYFDSDLLFRGYVERTTEAFNGELKVECKSDLALLGNVRVRPYTTVAGDEGYIGGSDFATLFSWLIGQYNDRCAYLDKSGTLVGTDRRFTIRYPSRSGTSLAQEGAKLDAMGTNLRESSQLPTVLEEIQNKILDPMGALLEVWYSGDTRCIALYADTPAQKRSGQSMTAGVNLTDISFEKSCTDVITAIRPEGQAPSDDNQSEEDSGTITLQSLSDGVVQGRYYKRGDAVYDIEMVAKYGYREEAWSDSDSSDAKSLLSSSINRLKTEAIGSESVDVQAVDMVFFDSTKHHLLPGDIVSVWTPTFSMDLPVSSCNINFDSPGSTTYTIGATAPSISRGYRSIVSEVSNASKASTGVMAYAKNAITTANNAVTTANRAMETADRASESVSGTTLVHVVTQSSEARANTVFTPEVGVTVNSAVMAYTVSIDQVTLSLTIDPESVINDKLGTLVDSPAIKTVIDGVDGHISTTGDVYAKIEASGDSASIDLDITLTFICDRTV